MLLSSKLTDDSRRPWAVSKKQQVAIGVRYLATNAHQIVLGDTLRCCQKTISNIIRKEVMALNHPGIVSRFIVCKPWDLTWCRNRSSEFARLGKFNVLGCIDGTLVELETPPQDGYLYMCRKGFSALNVCIVVDAIGRILYVNSSFPGSVHDATVWRRSTLGEEMTAGGTCAGYALIGGSGYANGNGIMAPIGPPVSEAIY